MMMGEIRRMTSPGGGVYGMAECAGQLLPVRQYQALFSLIGAEFGGDGRNTFALPNLPVESGPKNYIALMGVYPRFQ